MARENVLGLISYILALAVREAEMFKWRSFSRVELGLETEGFYEWPETDSQRMEGDLSGDACYGQEDRKKKSEEIPYPDQVF